MTNHTLLWSVYCLYVGWERQDNVNACSIRIYCIIVKVHVDGLVQASSNSIANALELLHSCTKPSICFRKISQAHSSWLDVLMFTPPPSIFADVYELSLQERRHLGCFVQCNRLPMCTGFRFPAGLPVRCDLLLEPWITSQENPSVFCDCNVDINHTCGKEGYIYLYFPYWF